MRFVLTGGPGNPHNGRQIMTAIREDASMSQGEIVVGSRAEGSLEVLDGALGAVSLHVVDAPQGSTFCFCFCLCFSSTAPDRDPSGPAPRDGATIGGGR